MLNAVNHPVVIKSAFRVGNIAIKLVSSNNMIISTHVLHTVLSVLCLLKHI